jgi:hypothetical protein
MKPACVQAPAQDACFHAQGFSGFTRQAECLEFVHPVFLPLSTQGICMKKHLIAFAVMALAAGGAMA